MGLAVSCRRGGRSFLARTERPSGSASPPFGGRATAARDTGGGAAVSLAFDTMAPEKVYRVASQMAELSLPGSHHVGLRPGAPPRKMLSGPRWPVGPL